MRRFEYSDGSSEKFWEISIDDTGYEVRYGRIGSNGQMKYKQSDDPEKDAKKQIAGKQKKGYVEVNASTPAVRNPKTEAPSVSSPLTVRAKNNPEVIPSKGGGKTG